MLVFRQLRQGAVQVALVIEDDPETLIAWAFVLRSFGFTVLEAVAEGRLGASATSTRGRSTSW